MSRPDLQIFGFCFLFFTSYFLRPFRAGAREGILGCGEGRVLYIYAFRRLPPLFLPSPPPAAARLRYPAFASGVATPSQKTDRCPCSASAVSATGSASAAQSRTRARLPSQSRRPCGRLASSPGGRAKFTPVDREKLCGKTKFFLLCLITNFAEIDAGTLASPRGAYAHT